MHVGETGIHGWREALAAVVWAVYRREPPQAGCREALGMVKDIINVLITFSVKCF